MIDLELLNKQQLLEFINSPTYSEMPILPISYHRAVSHINNPRATDSDVLLILAYEHNQLLGYLGILPDDIYTNKGDLLHVGWLSCIWVSPLARGKGIAKKMVLAAYEAYNHHIVITNFTNEAEALYQKLEIFVKLPPLNGIRYYRTMCLSKILTKRFPKTANISLLLKIVDFTFNIFWKPFLKKSNSHFNLNYELPNDDYINQSSLHQCNVGFKRQEKEFLWIKTFPWIKQVEEYSESSKKYHFSSEEKQFIAEILKVSDKNKVVGYFFYILRNGHLRIPYIIHKQAYTNVIANFIANFVQEKNADYVTLFLNHDIISQIRIRSIFKKQIVRKFLITKVLKEKIGELENLTIFDGDGDAIFT